MTRIHSPRRAKPAPRDRRRAPFISGLRGQALFLALGAGILACDGGVQETTRVTVAAAPRTASVPVQTGLEGPNGTDPASTPSQKDRSEPPFASGPVEWDTAEAAWRTRNYPEAVRLFTAWSEERPSNPWGHYMLGLSHWKAGDPERAEGALNRALELDPLHGRALVNLARVRLDMNRPDQALDPARRVTELEPASPDAWRVLGRVHHSRGEVDEAIAAYQSAALLDRHDAWSMNNLGLLMIEQERFEEALGPLALAAAVDSSMAVVQNNLGIALERTGRTVQAGVAFARAVALGDSEKAGVSLARVEGRTDRPGVRAVELTALALRFEEELNAAPVARALAARLPGEVPDPR